MSVKLFNNRLGRFYRGLQSPSVEKAECVFRGEMFGMCAVVPTHHYRSCVLRPAWHHNECLWQETETRSSAESSLICTNKTNPLQISLLRIWWSIACATALNWQWWNKATSKAVNSIPFLITSITDCSFLTMVHRLSWSSFWRLIAKHLLWGPIPLNFWLWAIRMESAFGTRWQIKQ